MGKIKTLIWTCYNGGSGAEPPEGRKNFRKFVEIGNVKFINFTKMAWISWTKLDKNIRIIENYSYIFRGEPPTLANFYESSLNFPLASLIFSLNSLVGPKKKRWEFSPFRISGFGGEAPERQRKVKNFTAKSEGFYEILKEFTGKW